MSPTIGLATVLIVAIVIVSIVLAERGVGRAMRRRAVRAALVVISLPLRRHDGVECARRLGKDISSVSEVCTAALDIQGGSNAVGRKGTWNGRARTQEHSIGCSVEGGDD